MKIKKNAKPYMGKKELNYVNYVVYYVACLYINENCFPYRIELI